MEIENNNEVKKFLVEAFEILSGVNEDLSEMKNMFEVQLIDRIIRGFHLIKSGYSNLKFLEIDKLVMQTIHLLFVIKEKKLYPDVKVIQTIENVTNSIREFLTSKKIIEKPEDYFSSQILEIVKLLPEPEKKRKIYRCNKPLREVGELKMLIAEDDLTSRMVMMKILQSFGSLDIAVNGKEAIDQVKNSHSKDDTYDFIFMDIMMPEVDGIEAVKKIRELEKEKGVSVLDESVIFMTTALDDPGIIIKSFYGAGANSYHIKPIEKEKVFKEITKFIQMRAK